MLRTLRITQLLSNPGFVEAFGRQRPCTLTLSCSDYSSDSEVVSKTQQFAISPCSLPFREGALLDLLGALACLVPLHTCMHLTGHARITSGPGSALSPCIS